MYYINETKKLNKLIRIYFYKFQFKKSKPLHLMSRRHFNRHTTSINKEKVGDNQSTIFASECLIPTKESVDSDNVLPSDEHPNTIEGLGLQSTNINFCNNFNDSNIPLTCDNDNIVNQLFTISDTQIEKGSILNKKLCQLIIKYKISHNCVNELLEILRSEGLDVQKMPEHY